MITTPIDIEKFSAKALEAFHNSGLKRTFKASDKSGNNEIIIYDIIGSEQTNAKTFSDALSAAGGSDITIRLSSPGGSVFEGWAMYHALKTYEGVSTVIVDGVCASIASVFALGADIVETQETSLWMVHNAWMVSVGNALELKANAEILEKIDENLAAVYAARSTNSDTAYWAAIMAKETWFTSSEAVKAGLADVISEAPPKKDKPVNQKAKIRQVMNIAPDQEMADDAAGMIDSAILLLQKASGLLSPEAPEEEGIDATSTGMARALRVRRAIAAGLS